MPSEQTPHHPASGRAAELGPGLASREREPPDWAEQALRGHVRATRRVSSDIWEAAAETSPRRHTHTLPRNRRAPRVRCTGARAQTDVPTPRVLWPVVRTTLFLLFKLVARATELHPSQYCLHARQSLEANLPEKYIYTVNSEYSNAFRIMNTTCNLHTQTTNLLDL